jgi:hypothetical protein
MLWVADSYNYRVLRFSSISSASTLYPGASGVLGAQTFNDYGISSPVNATVVYRPYGCAIDTQRNKLYVATNDYNRLLRFDNARSFQNFAKAGAVIGQPDFATTTYATTATKMSAPQYVAMDVANDYVFVSEEDNHRVLMFKGLSTVGAAVNPKAFSVIGQYDFVSGDGNQGTSYPTGQTFYYPYQIWYNAATGYLWAADNYNHRVLGFPGCTSSTKSKSKSKSRSRSRTKSKSKTKSKSHSKR